MKRSTVTASAASFVAALVLVACEETSNPPPPAPTVSVPSTTPAGTTPPAVASDAAATPQAPVADAASDAPGDDASADATAAAGGPGDVDGGAPAQFRACKKDVDCVAVPRVGCCHNGWKEAVAADQKDAYAKSFTCPTPHPICPMYLVKDDRPALCDNRSHLCTMYRPEDIPCGGFIANQHQCPDGYHCAVAPVPDVGGKCTK
jgi:hypothetical protein